MSVTTPNPSRTLSYQLYSSRNFPDLDRQCAMLAGLGFTAVEPFGGLLGNIDALEKALKDNGLAAPSCHVGLAMLRDDFAGTVAKLKRIGVTLAIVPYIAPAERVNTVDGWQALGRELTELAHRLSDEGFAFGWHNHDFEFVALADGSLPIEHILGDDPALGLELDIAWVVRGKADPAAWIARYASRIRAFHVKDIAAPGTAADEDGWADVGTGIIDYGALLPAMMATPASLLVLEHDNPSDDARFAARSLATVSKW
jgi:sugar phosphate isomerase/epimerase